MDGSQFDDLTRRLALSRRGALRFLTGGVLAALGSAADRTGGAAGPKKVPICHLTSSATNPYQYILVSDNPNGPHSRHAGDVINVNLQTNPSHCGDCGRTCPPPPSGFGVPVCTGGACTVACSTGYTDCANDCVDLQTYGVNCGACGATCPAGYSCCGGTCVDLSSDVDNCGACGTVCAGPHGGTCENERACGAGTCTYTPLPPGTTCRASAGTCDPAETCTGGSLECPSDAFQPRTVECRPATCVGGVETQAAACPGDGPTCPNPVTRPCASYVCDPDGTACLAGCAGDEACQAGHRCDDGQCLPVEGLGTACDEDGDCASGFCVDGVCCDGRCAGECSQCTAATGGVCTPASGQACGASGGQTCCDGSCCSAGEACDGGRCQPAFCLRGGESCGAASDGVYECCGGLTCSSDEEVCCAPAGAGCASFAECCGNACEDARCCVTNGRACAETADCCAGGESLVCRHGRCRPAACLPLEAVCLFDDDCCGDGQCLGGVCRPACRTILEACDPTQGLNCCTDHGVCRRGECCDPPGASCITVLGGDSCCQGSSCHVTGSGDEIPRSECVECTGDFNNLGGGVGCQSNAECCSGYCHPRTGNCCRTEGQRCSKVGPFSGECCPYLGLTCSGGLEPTCIQCKTAGQSCEEGEGLDSTCCLGFDCEAGVCVQGGCGVYGGICQHDAACCEGMTCFEDLGLCGFLCAVDGQPCDWGCCDGYICDPHPINLPFGVCRRAN